MARHHLERHDLEVAARDQRRGLQLQALGQALLVGEVILGVGAPGGRRGNEDGVDPRERGELYARALEVVALQARDHRGDRDRDRGLTDRDVDDLVGGEADALDGELDRHLAHVAGVVEGGDDRLPRSRRALQVADAQHLQAVLAKDGVRDHRGHGRSVRGHRRQRLDLDDLHVAVVGFPPQPAIDQHGDGAVGEIA